MSPHLIRVIFWAAQIPPAVYFAFVPAAQRYLFAYLVIISLAALVESAFTDYRSARAERAREEEDDHDG